MNRIRHWGLIGVCVLLAGLGVACFNFTKPSGLEHHRAVAAENGLPAPSDGIAWLGVVLLILGAGTAGLLTGRSTLREL